MIPRRACSSFWNLPPGISADFAVPHFCYCPTPIPSAIISPVMLVKDLGEFGLIERLNARITRERGGPDNGAAFAFRLLVDTGDDTAAWQTGAATELATTDTVVEGIHFTRETTPWRDLGWKALAANISDIAAMGGQPLYALITLGLPRKPPLPILRNSIGGCWILAIAMGRP